MRWFRTNKLLPKVVAGLLAGIIIGEGGFTYARSHWYSYDNGNGGLFWTKTHYADHFDAYLGIVGGPIPVKDSQRLAKSIEEFNKAKEIVSTVGDIAKNTQQLIGLFTGKDVNLGSGVFSNATNVMNRVMSTSPNSLFHINKTVKNFDPANPDLTNRPDLILNTRLTYAGLKDPDRVTKYVNDLYAENEQINNEAQIETQRLSAELERVRTAINNVVSETNGDAMSDADRNTAIAALKDQKKRLENEVNSTDFKQTERVNSNFVSNGGAVGAITALTQHFLGKDNYENFKNKLTSKNVPIDATLEAYKKENPNYMRLMESYGDARGSELDYQNTYDYEYEGRKPGGYVDKKYDSYVKLKDEYEELLKMGPPCYVDVREDEYGYTIRTFHRGYYYDDDYYSYYNSYYYWKRWYEEAIEKKENLLTALQAKITEWHDIGDERQPKVQASGSDTIHKEELNQNSYLQKTQALENASLWLTSIRLEGKYDPSKMSDAEQQKLLDSVKGTGIVSEADINNTEIAARQKQADSLTRSQSAEHTQYRDKLEKQRDVETQIKALESGDVSTTKELQKEILLEALTAKRTEIEESIEIVRQKREMYQEATQKRLQELEEMKSRSNMASMTSRDPWNQDDVDKKKHPTRKGFGLKHFKP